MFQKLIFIVRGIWVHSKTDFRSSFLTSLQDNEEEDGENHATQLRPVTTYLWTDVPQLSAHRRHDGSSMHRSPESTCKSLVSASYAILRTQAAPCLDLVLRDVSADTGHCVIRVDSLDHVILESGSFDCKSMSAVCGFVTCEMMLWRHLMTELTLWQRRSRCPACFSLLCWIDSLGRDSRVTLRAIRWKTLDWCKWTFHLA